jgi:hypothetical protein
LSDRKKLLLATLLALVAVVGFSLAMSKWGGNSATEENNPSFGNLVTRAKDAANQAAEEFNQGS